VVRSDVVPLQQAMNIPGLRAVFGEAYPDPVRVVSMQPKVRLSICCSVSPIARSGTTDSNNFKP
jgi:alanyl-tRNA synthetase